MHSDWNALCTVQTISASPNFSETLTPLWLMLISLIYSLQNLFAKILKLIVVSWSFLVIHFVYISEVLSFYLDPINPMEMTLEKKFGNHNPSLSFFHISHAIAIFLQDWPCQTLQCFFHVEKRSCCCIYYWGGTYCELDYR